MTASEAAQAHNNQGADVDDLKVTKIHIDAAPQFKRFGSKAKGRGTRIIKRNSHITVVVGDGKKDE
jgi:large subunit ribosomal protein L22